MAVVVWAAALAGRHAWGPAAALVAGALVVVLGRTGMAVIVAAGLVAGAWAGWGALQREETVLGAPVVEGRVSLRAVARTDPKGNPENLWLLAKPLAYRAADTGVWRYWQGPVILVETSDGGEVITGEVFETSGILSKRPGHRGSVVHAGRLRSRELVRVSPAQGWLVAAGNQMRTRVLSNLRTGPDDGLALLAGFLVGDTDDLSVIDLGNLRRSGLSHYVAVSGGNVALFLGALWILIGPLASRPGLRALVGLIGLGVFMVATRWEPSVLRAGLLAALVLGARAIGYPLSAWTAIGITVVGALLVSPELAQSWGFALSVAATLGVMVGMRLTWRRKPRWLWQTLGASMGAQVAVAPLLLGFFGSVPLLSPLANLMVGPLVAVSTGLGGVGALLGWSPLVGLAAQIAQLILAVAGFFSPFPQLGWWETGLVGCLAAMFWRWPVLRVPLAGVGVLLVAVAPLSSALMIGPGPGGASPPAVVFLDVGQGDSILVLGTGLTVLIDGGPDPLVLAEKLRRYRVTKLDLVVISHPHADHVRGLEAVIGEISVGTVWDASHPHQTPAHRLLRERIAQAGIPRHRPVPGESLQAGDLTIEVLGPLRRYQGINDQSIVLLVNLAGATFLMAADIEEVAQAELGVIGPHVLKVPHQGAATSDRKWLHANAGRLAVISVGPNNYGHPVRWVEEALVAAGAQVMRTDQSGDIVVKPAPSENRHKDP